MHDGYRMPGNGAIVAAVCNGLKKAGGKGLICQKILKKNNAILITL